MLGNRVYSSAPGIPRSTFEEDFLAHKNCSEWWYSTGYFTDDEGSMFACQWTLARFNIKGLFINMLLTSLTDIRRGKHYYSQSPSITGNGVVTNHGYVGIVDKSWMTFAANEFSSNGIMEIHTIADNYRLDVNMEAAKAPVWHCDNGELFMGQTSKPLEKTFYYSYTNIPAVAALVLDGRTYSLKGKCWFDRQGGPYNVIDRHAAWEWFSLRFFDDTEAMLFAFPQCDYFDGTFIERDGTYRRMNDYVLKATKVIETAGKKFSAAWKLEMNGASYTLRPTVEGMFNYFFYEELTGIFDADDELVGYCFTELMPAVRNPASISAAFKKV